MKEKKLEYMSFVSDLSRNFEPQQNTDLNIDEFIHEMEGKLAMIKVDNCIEMEKCDNIETEIEINLHSIKVIFFSFLFFKKGEY